MIPYLARLAPPPRKKPLSRLVHSYRAVRLPPGSDYNGCPCPLAGVKFCMDPPLGVYIGKIGGAPGVQTYEGASRTITPDELREIADTADAYIERNRE